MSLRKRSKRLSQGEGGEHVPESKMQSMINKRRSAFRTPSATGSHNILETDLYTVMNKGGRWDLQDIKRLE